MPDISCSQLTEAVLHIKSQISELDSFVLKRNANEAIGIKKALNAEINELLGKIDPFKIRIRKNIAKNFDLADIRITSGGLFWGMFKESDKVSDSKKYQMFDKNGAPVGRPHDSIIDTGKGICLVYDHSNQRYTYSLINHDGEIIKELPEVYTHFNFSSGDFTENGAFAIKLTGGKLAFLKSDGKIIFRGIKCSEDQRFHEGLTLVEDIRSQNTYHLYDTNENLIKTINNTVMISSYSNGHAIGLKYLPDNSLGVVLFDRDGNSKSMGVKTKKGVDCLSIGCNGSIYFVHYLTYSSRKIISTHYFTDQGFLHHENNPTNGKNILIDPQTSDYFYWKKVKGGLNQIFDKNSELLCPDLFKNVIEYEDGFILCTDPSGYYCFIGKNGNKLHVENKLLDARSFINGYAAVKDNGGWFLINNEGNDAFRGKRFDNVPGHVVDGVINVYDNGKKIFLDYHGNKVWGE